VLQNKKHDHALHGQNYLLTTIYFTPPQKIKTNNLYTDPETAFSAQGDKTKTN